MATKPSAEDKLLALLRSGGHAAQEAGYGPVAFGSDGHTYAARTAHALKRKGLATLEWGSFGRFQCWAWTATKDAAAPPEQGVMDIAYVITWRYSDGSGSGATAVFTDKARAERLVEILDKTDSMRQFKIEAVPFDLGTTPAPKEAPSEASRWPNMNQTVAANAFWHPPHPVLKGWIHDCVYSTGQVLLPEGSTCTNCGATMIAPATPGTPGGGR